MPVSDIDLLREAATEAGNIAQRYFQRDFDVFQKDDNQGPVTEADLEIDAYLKSALLAQRPDYGWLSEETEDSVDRLNCERVFIVDPIDGTRSFVAGQKTFSHSLAIAQNGVVTHAVVFLPMLDRLYEAEQGSASRLNGQLTQPAHRSELTGARILAAAPQLDPAYWPGGVPEIDRHHRPSLAYRLCLAAEGQFDGMLTLRDAWEWDIAAGDLICRNAGLLVTDRLGQPLRFNNETPKQKGVLAAGRPVHQGFMDHLKT